MDLSLFDPVRSVWYSVVVSNGISSVILYVLYRAGIWKKSKIKMRKKEFGLGEPAEEESAEKEPRAEEFGVKETDSEAHEET